jgi:hypothetical protein
MLVGETQSFALASRYGAPGVHYGEYRIGGTSLASPLLAGIQAVAQQGAGARLGFANPLIYALESKSTARARSTTRRRSRATPATPAPTTRTATTPTTASSPRCARSTGTAR